MIAVTGVIAVVALAISVYSLYHLRREMRRNRILQAFISGTILEVVGQAATVSRLHTAMDKVAPEYGKADLEHDPSRRILARIKREFGEDFWDMASFVKWDRNIFWNDKMANVGFVQLYEQLYYAMFKEWVYFDNTKVDERSGFDVETAGERLIYEKLMKNETSGLLDKLPKHVRTFFKHLSEDEIRKLVEKFKFKDDRPSAVA